MRLADLFGPFANDDTLPMVFDSRGRLVLILLRQIPVGQVGEAVALQQGLRRGVLVVC